MKRVHFFKAKSRLGLLNPPFGSDLTNVGVEDAPDVILADDFLSRFKQYRLSSFEFTKPEKVKKSEYFSILAQQMDDFRKLINTNLRRGQTQVVIGGDDSVSFSSILAVLERVGNPKKFGYLRFDAHGDMNLAGSSPTGNFHGMYHRPLLGDFDIPQISQIVKYKLDPQSILFVGNLNLDFEERQFFRNLVIKNYDKQALLKRQTLTKINEFIFSFPYLHVSFDIDALDSKIAPATGIPAKDGLYLSDVLPILKTASKHPNLSFDLVEVNPKKKGAQKTIKVARKILGTLGS